MPVSRIPVKVLLAEDSSEALQNWILGLYRDGFHCDDSTPAGILAATKEATLVVLKKGPHQIHITRYAHILGQTVMSLEQERSGAGESFEPYAACFIDRSLERGEKSDAHVRQLLKNNLAAQVYLISSDVDGQAHALGQYQGFSVDALLREGRLVKSTKMYRENRPYLANLGLWGAARPPDPAAVVQQHKPVC